MGKSKSKTKMPKDLKKKCHAVIHSAAAAAGVAGASPIPFSDALPISVIQIAMVVGLGKVFDVPISESAAKTIVGLGLTNNVGPYVVTNILKAVPGVGTVVGGTVRSVTASSLTEALGWFVADDFYRISVGEDPTNLSEAASDIKTAFESSKH